MQISSRRRCRFRSLVLAGCALSLAACGVFGADPDARVVTVIDAGDARDVCGEWWRSSSCNLLTQTGCSPGQRCAWVRLATDLAAPEACGQLGCVPDGTVPIGGACAWGPSGPVTGHDDCAAGGVCDVEDPRVEQATGTCARVCSLGDATLPCPAGTGCGIRDGLFHNRPTDAPLAGVCESTCDPLTQIRHSDGAAACGSTAMPPDRGCYGFPSSSAMPTELVCFAFCAPLTINNTTPVANRAGSPPYSCPEVGAPAPGERCQHLWFWEGIATPLSTVSNALGVCVDFTRYTGTTT